MTETLSFEPSRLALARRRRGLSRSELAEQAALKPRTIVAYESGERAPGPDAMSALVNVLGFPAEFFCGSAVESVGPNGVSFRSLSKTSKAKREKALSAADLAFMLTDWIESRFSLPTPNVPDLHPVPVPDVAAEAIRTRWGLGDKPIGNMVRLLEANGVRVFSLAENTREIDAFSLWRRGVPFVFLNTLKSPERSRFDAAHELGHLVLHQHGQTNGRQAEVEANAFASAFLMPKTSILAHAPTQPMLSEVVAAKRGWGVSAAALVHRLHRLERMTEWQYFTLCRQIQTHGYREEEPNSMPRELSNVWPQVFAALREEGVSRADFARSLSLPLEELRGLVFQLVLSADPSSGGTVPFGPSVAPTDHRLRMVR